MRAATLARRRGVSGGGGGGLTFLGVSSIGRPSPATPSEANSLGWRLRPFTTRAEMDTILKSIVPNDYAYYNVPGQVLQINSSSAASAYTFPTINLASPAVLDLGCRKSIWAPGYQSAGYVSFNNTYTAAQGSGVVFNHLTNLRVFGGDVYNAAGQGIELGDITNVLIWDMYIHNVGSSGVWGRDAIGSAANSIIGCDFRIEVDRFCMRPDLDVTHDDRGSGQHGWILHGGVSSTGATRNNRFITWVHDSLRPGEVSFGTAYPEGGGGSGMEVGHGGTGPFDGNIYYCKFDNLLMIPNGTNPGSIATQFGGCGIAAYGAAPLNNNTWKWLEGNNMTGAVFHGNPGGSWMNGVITVEHGRHSNVNQFTGVSGMSGENGVPFDQQRGIIYQDTDYP